MKKTCYQILVIALIECFKKELKQYSKRDIDKDAFDTTLEEIKQLEAIKDNSKKCYLYAIEEYLYFLVNR